MDLRQITLDQFLCRPDHLQLAPSIAEPVDYDIFHDFRGTHHGDLPDSNLSLHWFGGSEENVMLLDGQDVVGVYCGEWLSIMRSHRGRCLSVPLILAAIEHRPMPAERKVTEAGLKALEKAWRVGNGLEPNPWPLDAF